MTKHLGISNERDVPAREVHSMSHKVVLFLQRDEGSSVEEVKAKGKTKSTQSSVLLWVKPRLQIFRIQHKFSI
jgi:hypothetical protein